MSRETLNRAIAQFDQNNAALRQVVVQFPELAKLVAISLAEREFPSPLSHKKVVEKFIVDLALSKLSELLFQLGADDESG